MNEGEDAPPRILPRRSRLALGPILHIPNNQWAPLNETRVTGRKIVVADPQKARFRERLAMRADIASPAGRSNLYAAFGNPDNINFKLAGNAASGHAHHTQITVPFRPRGSRSGRNQY
jgi:hypothetical protein